MSHHDSDIPKRIYSPPLVWKVEPSRTYGNPVGLFHPMVVESHEDLSKFIDYINAERWYWSHIPGGETQQAPTSTSTIRYGMPDLPDTDL